MKFTSTVMQTFVVAKAGSEVGTIFKDGEKYWIESVGERSAYIKTTSGDVVILSRKLFTPYSIVFGEAWESVRKRLAVKHSVLYNEPFLEIGDGLKICVKVGEDSPKITFNGKPDVERLRQVYNVYMIIASVSELDGYVECLRSVRVFDTQDVLNCLVDVVGRGPGLTPAGDDFVSGVLLGLRLLGLKADASELFQKARKSSRWPSWKMMEHAHHGCTFSPIYNLCREILMGGDCVEHVFEAVRIGGSTGLATLAGLLETLRIFSEQLV
ncbi:hypothetical protein CSUB_C0518 [Candidatus Caldarchaeum subterraneum]|uniref:DUF2877 domain-containing protein n=1 Tax=Caldiarchaeum subterraneum TaxID=311458 RepID=E6N5K6_CALS0|nr:hypothetical protein HGMM_F52E01C20 [Candidatus Caldarchaeum subterraneum]BAJ50379.1 hypothetical protein CSUB_C0518 [Candidatus Caldarchaeum subterraneum]